MAQRAHRQGIGIAAAVGLLALLIGAPGLAGTVHRFDNGITATVYGARELAEHSLTVTKEGTFLTHPAVGTVELAADPVFTVPLDEAAVTDALAAMHGFVTSVAVDVFILPALPANPQSSFARRDAIFLAPGSGPTAASTTAYITTHEMGHVLTWAFLDEHPDRWKAYLAARGLDTDALDPAAPHADRAREILAEDIRALFGGSRATVTGTIENHDLVHPDRVAGLQDLLIDFFRGGPAAPFQVASRAFPNPCNPMTSIEMSLPADLNVSEDDPTLRIFDVRGALVRSIRGGQVANGRVVVPWDGTGRGGETVSSGRYLYVLEVGNLVATGSVTLVR